MGESKNSIGLKGGVKKNRRLKSPRMVGKAAFGTTFWDSASKLDSGKMDSSSWQATPIDLLKGTSNMPWYFYVLDFLSGLFLANGIPHFVQGVSGHRFQSPFASPPGVGESSPLSNALWGFANLAVGFVLLWFFGPQGSGAGLGWIVLGLGVLVMAVGLSIHFGKVRSKKP